MTTNPSQERRTRSQIRLSDDILKLPEHSPMKNARNAIRTQSEPLADMDTVDDSEDELLLSPNKSLKPSRSKRSVSPPPENEYSPGASGGRSGRELKRMKWDLGEGEVKNLAKARLAKAGHARTNSLPNAGPNRKMSHKRAGVVTSGNKPNSTSNVPQSPIIQSPTGVPGKTRAQSVPLFPSFSSMPSLDLRNPPLSPIRARSPSRPPDKYHGLRVHPSPSKQLTSEPPQVEAFDDEPKVSMEVIEEPMQPIADPDTTMESATDTIAPVPDVSTQPSESPTSSATSNVPSVEPPVTPVPSGLSLYASMSPLTPLPETPLPLKVVAEDEDRYSTKDGWGFNLEKEPELQSIPQPDFGKPKDAPDKSNVLGAASRSQIPRPSLAPPTQCLDKTTSGPENTQDARQPPLRIAAHKGSSSSSSSTNAFSFLMKTANKQGTNKSQDKGKGKGSSLLSKVVVGAVSNGPKERGRVVPEVKKVSLKDRMRRKEKPKPVVPAKFVPLIFDEDEDQEEAEQEPKQMEPEPEEKNQFPALSEAVPQEPEVPTPLPPEGALAVSPATIPLPKVPVSIETESTLLQPRPPSPISSITSLSESEPEASNLGNPQQGPATPPAVATEERAEQGVQEQSTPIVVLESKQISATVESKELNAKASTEAQASEGPHLTPQFGDSPAKEPAQPIKPKPTARKRAQSSIPTSSRVTRSAVKPPAPFVAKPAGHRSRAATDKPRKSLSGATIKKAPSTTTAAATEPGDLVLPPGSPMQTSSPLRALSREFRTPGSSPAKISLTKTPSKPNFSAEGSPSPTKIARAVSMFSRPSDAFAVDDIGMKSNGSSLSTLSNALEKLKMPVPSRPNTSLGFNPRSGEDEDGDVLLSDQHLEPSNMTLRTSSLRRNNSIQRSFTVGHDTTAGPSRAPALTQSGLSMGKPRLVQKPVTSFFTKPGSSSSTLTNLRSAKGQLLGSGNSTLNGAGAKGKGKDIFGIGGRGLFPMTNKRLVQKVSKKSSLPVVEASPVKGGGNERGLGTSDVDDSIIDGETLIMNAGRSYGKANEGTTKGDMGDVFIVPLAKGDDEMQVETSDGGEKSAVDKGKEKEREKSWRKDSSRRASMALSQLSQSLSAAPAYGIGEKGNMGPPATPRRIARSASSSYPAPSNTHDDPPATAASASIATPPKSATSPDKAPPPSGIRFSIRRAAKAAMNAESKSPSTSAGPEGPGKRNGAEKDKDLAAPAKKAESLKILNECVIFVDVRTDDGEEAGSLFVEMLEGLGAKILARVGQTCTHVIFKNGLMSTISRYRLLRDPKPSVVGIAWVVDCVEQRRRVEEAPYLIDLKEVNVAGTNKRRRSMLPKLISSLVEKTPTEVDPDEEDGEADVSMDGSTSSITLDDDLTPLERARRRRSMIFGPPV